MAEQLSGAELDARFFEVCLPSRMARIGVSTDANCCEAWAMRWAREQGFIWSTGLLDGEGAWAELEQYGGRGKDIDIIRHGTDWKGAFVRACVAAAEELKTKGET